MELTHFEVEKVVVVDANSWGEPAATVVTIMAQFGPKGELGRTMRVVLQLPRNDDATPANIHKSAHAELVKFLPEAARQIGSRVAEDGTKLKDDPPQA